MPTQVFPPRPEIRPEPKTPPAPSASGLRRGIDRVLDTSPELTLTACRLVLGGVMLVHGGQSVLGWLGGPGFSGAVRGFHEQLGIPTAIAVVAILAEFLGSLLLLVGFLGRVGAACIIADMIGAILLVHAPNGFFMNWTGKRPGEGFEYHLLAIALALPVLVKGSGAFSVDHGLLGRLRRDQTPVAGFPENP
jgi:putative oxidoreductase